MKKCPYCAEEIQDEAIYCRYCHRDLVPAVAPSPSTQVAPPVEAEHPQPDFKLKSIFWPALGVGLIIGFLIFTYRLSLPTVSYQDALFGGISSIFIYGFLFSLLVFIWRVIIKRIPGVRAFSSASGCASMLIFLGGMILFVLLMVFGMLSSAVKTSLFTSVNPKPQTTHTAQATQATQTSQVKTVLPTITQRPETTITRSSASTTDMGDLVWDLFSSHFLDTTNGFLIQKPDFRESQTKDHSAKWFPINEEAADFIIRADASWESASSIGADASGCGFVFHAQDENNFYDAFLTTEREANLIRVEGGEVTEQWHASTEFVSNPEKPIELVLAVQRNRFTFLVNDMDVLQVYDYKISGKSLGLSIHSGTNQDYGTRCTMKYIDIWNIK